MDNYCNFGERVVPCFSLILCPSFLQKESKEKYKTNTVLLSLKGYSMMIVHTIIDILKKEKEKSTAIKESTTINKLKSMWHDFLHSLVDIENCMSIKVPLIATQG